MKVLNYSYFLLLFLFACNENSSKYNYVLTKSDSGIFVEKFDKSVDDDNRYTLNNSVYKEGNVYSYNYIHLAKDGKRYQFSLQEKSENWVFNEENDRSDTSVVGYTLIVLNGMSWMKETIPDYDQSVIRFIFKDSKGGMLQASETGLIENEKNIWMHPPRVGYFKILELNPFPYIQAPYEVGNKWEWELGIGSHWGDERWMTWNRGIQNKYTYEITDFSTIKTSLGELDCYVIDAEGKGDIGETKLTSWFSFEYGFVKLEYTNIDSSKTIIELKKFKGTAGEKSE